MTTAFDIKTLWVSLPEIFLLSAIVMVLMVDVFSKKESKLTYYLSQLSLTGTFILTALLLLEPHTIIFNGHFIADAIATHLKLVMQVLAMMFLLYSRHYLMVHKLYQGEYFVLSLLAVLGMMVMVSGYSLLSLYLGLELMSLSLYTLIAMAKKRTGAVEAAFKYFMLGAIASALLLYGMSMLYGISGSLYMGDIATMAGGALDTRQILILNFALVFILIGIAFKLGAVPFHMWIPDVYQGAPTSVTMLLTSIPKIAAFAIMLRLLVDTLGAMSAYWQDLLMVLALLSIALGSVVAIVQDNLKRLLAYSTIAHVGFILLGFASGGMSSYASALFYVLTYALVGLFGFGIIIFLNRNGFEAEQIKDYQGLAKSQPLAALMMLIVILSMAGVPPFIGFYAKFFVLQQVLAQGHTAAAIAAVVLSVVAAFYYLKVIKAMYFSEPIKAQTVVAAMDVRVLLVINMIAVIVLSLLPDKLLQITKTLLAY